ncbi:DUF1266 domain-containing protein [Prevotella aurantiaca]
MKEQVEIDKYISNTFTLEKDARECKQQIEHAFKSIDNLVKLGIVKDGKEFVRIGTAGWNATRLVSISRMCAKLKYISEDELWQFIDKADEKAHQSLTSWKDFGKSDIIGLCLWGADKYEIKRQIREVYKLLDNPKSPWLTFSFAK